MKRRQYGQFPTLTNLKITESAVFYLKVFNKLHSWDVFEEYIIFKNFGSEGVVELYLFKVSEVIYPPQPPGLGLKVLIKTFVVGDFKIKK